VLTEGSHGWSESDRALKVIGPTTETENGRANSKVWKGPKNQWKSSNTNRLVESNINYYVDTDRTIIFIFLTRPYHNHNHIWLSNVIQNSGFKREGSFSGPCAILTDLVFFVDDDVCRVNQRSSAGNRLSFHSSYPRWLMLSLSCTRLSHNYFTIHVCKEEPLKKYELSAALSEWKTCEKTDGQISQKVRFSTGEMY